MGHKNPTDVIVTLEKMKGRRTNVDSEAESTWVVERKRYKIAVGKDPHYYEIKSRFLN